MYCFYVPAEQEEVADGTRRAAKGMLAAASEDLGLEGMELRWFREETPEEIAERESWRAGGSPLSEEDLNIIDACVMHKVKKDTGHVVRLVNEKPVEGCYDQSRPNEVWAAIGSPPRRTAHVVAHELRHAYHHRRYRPENIKGYDPENPPDLKQFFEGNCESYAEYAVRNLRWQPQKE